MTTVITTTTTNTSLNKIVINLNQFVIKMLDESPILPQFLNHSQSGLKMPNFYSTLSNYVHTISSFSQQITQLNTRKTTIKWLVLLYLIAIIPSISSKPFSNKEKRAISHPKWINPCGIRSNFENGDNDTELALIPRISDSLLLQQIIAQARIAFREADSFKEEYVKKVFKMDFKTHHAIWKPHTVKWLLPENIPKTLHEKTNKTHLSKLELDESLLEIYKYLQRVAVGLEQVVWSQEDIKGPFQQHFKDIDYKLRALLCEIHVAILERGLAFRKDESRDIMEPEQRKPSSRVHQNLRDWFIFRDYMNSLEYVIDVFEYFKLKMRLS